MNDDAKQVLTELLVLRAQAGEAAAFRELHGLWTADLWRFTIRRVERADAAADVVSDAWLDIARSLHRLDDPACFPRWAFQIAARRGADWIRRRQTERSRQAATEAMADELAPPPIDSALPAEPADELLALRAAIARLPRDARDLLHLFYDLGRSVAEIAEILDVPTGTVKSRLFHLRDSLRKTLDPKIP